ncbi:MAG: hypothetical protein CME65_04990 [Halobacteriovoraceae bacterium]|nr:hypothetical protein [Halobacteriovoraceae bacterium]
MKIFTIVLLINFATNVHAVWDGVTHNYELNGRAHYSLERMPGGIENGTRRISELIERVTGCADLEFYHEIQDGIISNSYKINLSSLCLGKNGVKGVNLDYFNFYARYPDSRSTDEVELGITLEYDSYRVRIENGAE